MPRWNTTLVFGAALAVAATLPAVSMAAVVDPFAMVGESPRGIALDPAGNIYTANAASDSVTKITPGGVPSDVVTLSLGSTPIGHPGVGCLQLRGPHRSSRPRAIGDRHARNRAQVKAGRHSRAGHHDRRGHSQACGRAPRTVTGCGMLRHGNLHRRRHEGDVVQALCQDPAPSPHGPGARAPHACVHADRRHRHAVGGRHRDPAPHRRAPGGHRLIRRAAGPVLLRGGPPSALLHPTWPGPCGLV